MKTETAAVAANALANRIGALIDGEALPPVESPAFAALTEHVRIFLNYASDSDRAHFGSQVLALLLRAGQAQIASEVAMRRARGGAA
mgnify:CR=1 FL=1|jgi:hypothetical protein